MASSTSATHFGVLLDALDERVDACVEETVGRLVGEVDSYRNHDPEELRPVVRGNIASCLEDFHSGRGAETRAEQHREAGRVRAAQGVTVDDMLHGWRLGVDALRAAAHDVARELDLPDATVLEFTDRCLAWADRGMFESAAAHRRAELDLARHEQHVRANVVRGVVLGALPPSELKVHAMAYGLDLGSLYTPFRARLSDELALRALERRLGVADGTGPRAGLAALVDGDLAGFTARLPTDVPDDLDVVVGVGPAAPLDQQTRSFALATRALHTAAMLGRRGLVRFEQLGPRPAVLEDDDVGDVLVARIVAPVLAQGSAGQTILDTVTRFLANDRRLDRTAAELHAHVNTIRYRLQRFEQLSGQELRSTVDLVETWWALERASTLPRGDAT